MKSSLGECTPHSSPTDPDFQQQKHFLASFFKTLRQHFGHWKELFAGVADPRQVGKITYPLRVVLFTD